MRYACYSVLFAASVWAAGKTGPEPVTFNKDVLPILQNNCQGCHRPGEAAPMSFLTYEETRPWARAIKAKVLTREMPPWFADPQYGRFRNERRLELCFEGFRFWDLRRWMADLTEPARGVRIEGDNYSYFTVEARSYDNDYMHYGPIPQREVVKFGFEQNNGW